MYRTQEGVEAMAKHDQPADPAPSIRRDWRWAFRRKPGKEPRKRPEPGQAVILDRTDRSYTLSVLLSMLRR